MGLQKQESNTLKVIRSEQQGGFWYERLDFDCNDQNFIFY